jgi:hypothetical protein
MSRDLEQVTVTAYNEFHDAHKELLKENPTRYWQEATDFRDRRLQEYKIASGYYAATKTNRGRKEW